MYNNRKNIFCNNCGKIGHLFHQCKIPITSIGIIAIRIVNNSAEVLLIRRKDSLAFVDFMRGKYILEDINYIVKILEKMTLNEHKMLLENDFKTLWNYLWGSSITNQYKNEEKLSLIKFEKLKNGYIINNKFIDINYLINNCKNSYNEPEWGFPKGRRNYQEKDIICGLREFEEETGYLKDNIIIINNILPFDEIFTSSNYKSYKHKYYIGLFKNFNQPEKSFQLNEISKVSWVKLDEAEKYIRNYNVEKKNIIIQLNNLLKTYKVYI
jgi:8-oxo-dGTP pyrophosphatase MutT (NUDIX family)